MKLKYYIPNCFIFLILLTAFASCNKLVEISEPTNTITTSEVFSTNANANSAVAGMYSQMCLRPYLSSSISILSTLSSDELINYDGGNTFFNELQTNTLQANSSSSYLSFYFWNPLYSSIYKANSIIEGLAAAKSVSPSVKNQLTGEAKFVRAFCHFYLTNLFGDVPLVLTSAWANTSVLKRTPSIKVYDQIIQDLTDAKSMLAEEYASSNGARTRVNKWAATAFLARVYLYSGDWANAEKQASAVIDGASQYSLAYDLNSAFSKSSSEAIWQLEVVDNSPWATYDGNQFIPYDSTSSPNFYLSNQLLDAFEPGDTRRSAWIDSSNSSGTIYYYPFKYKVRESTPDNITESYMVLRLAELYLIRAEARAQQNKADDAIADINIIRNRANLSPLPGGGSRFNVLAAVAQERRVEFFSEWGHRWLDLKRTGQADTILPIIKSQWKPVQKLYPIPITELRTDPNLTQNEGY